MINYKPRYFIKEKIKFGYETNNKDTDCFDREQLEKEDEDYFEQIENNKILEL